ncbi:hypothetical protein REPUB_Repub17cG0171700 [Reevesia pubescens]
MPQCGNLIMRKEAERCLPAARERIMRRETQLRAFYSTTKEISVLFANQQEQLKAMQRAPEDEENYENTSVSIDLNVPMGNINGTIVREKATVGYHGNSATKAGSSTSAQTVNISSDEASVTEKHELWYEKSTPVLEGDAIGAECVLETESLGIEVERNIDLKRSGTLAGDAMQFDYETNAHESDERIQTTRYFCTFSVE